MAQESWNTPYELLGGADTVDRLVKAFYPKVLKDPDLQPLFQDGIEEIMNKQYLFLTQFLGGPALYSDKYGPPAMRQRHLRFEITPKRAKAWLACMSEAMDEIGLHGEMKDYFFQRLTQVAYIMVNTADSDEV